MTDSNDDNQPETFADSTVAMTLYNILAMTRGAMSVDKLRVAASKLQLAGLDLEQTERALDGLVERGRAVKHPNGNYVGAAKERLMVVQRDLGDYDSKTMEGGWEGWFVKDPRIRDGVGVRPLESLLGQTPTGRTPRPLPTSGKPSKAKPKKARKRRPKSKAKPSNAAPVLARVKRETKDRLMAARTRSKVRMDRRRADDKVAAEARTKRASEDEVTR